MLRLFSIEDQPDINLVFLHPIRNILRILIMVYDLENDRNKVFQINTVWNNSTCEQSLSIIFAKHRSLILCAQKHAIWFIKRVLECQNTKLKRLQR